jgi:DNA-binding CsgD family transcriptional regulator
MGARTAVTNKQVLKEGVTWLVTTSGATGNLPFCLEEGEYVVGRGKRCQIILADATVSRRHALVICHRNLATIEDLGSSNGTFLNDFPVSRCEFGIGDQIRFGGVLCAVTSSALANRPAAEQESTVKALKDQTSTIPLDQSIVQQKIIEQLLQGRGEREIAQLLCQSPESVHTHIQAIFQRLGVQSRAELIVKLLPRL